jgi:hypothetical protein
MPEEAIVTDRTIGETLVSITHFTPERFAASPQVGLSLTQNWESFSRWLSWPSYADNKKAFGAWCPCALEGGRVKEGRGVMSLLVFDVDHCVDGGIDKSACELKNYRGVIVPTYSATSGEKPEAHRIVLLPSRSLTVEEFKIAWPFTDAALAREGIVLDRACKNVNRLYFACVARSAETWTGARILEGRPIDVDAMLTAAREEAAEREAERKRRPPPRPVEDRHRDKYVRGALDAARRNIEGAGEGGRHDALLREAFSLPRLDLTEADIERELLPSFVAVAGEARRYEGTKAIRDAVAARRKAGAA